MSKQKSLESILKNARLSQPFNRLATNGLRSVLSIFGTRSEFLIKHLHRIDLVESELPNGAIFRLNSKGDDWVSNQVFWRGWNGYEPETAPLFFRFAQKARVTLDIGAYVGFFTILAAHANPAGKVFSFEPLTAIYERLKQNIVLNSLSNVEAIFGAAGSEEGAGEFFHVGGIDLPTSSSLSYEFMKDATDLTSTKVKIFKLDAFLKERNLGKVDLMKIDTESTEPDVLRGAIHILEESGPNIVCEVLKDRGSERDLQEILRPLGYRFYLLTPEGAVEREQIEGHPEFLNYLFTKTPPEGI